MIEPEDYGGGELWKKYTDLDPLDPRTKECEFLEDRHYLLCPSIIRGFSTKVKQWGKSLHCFDSIMAFHPVDTGISASSLTQAVAGKPLIIHDRDV